VNQNSVDPIVHRTSDLPILRAVPQPTAHESVSPPKEGSVFVTEGEQCWGRSDITTTRLLHSSNVKNICSNVTEINR
jgi:hypothetical protein